MYNIIQKSNRKQDFNKVKYIMNRIVAKFNGAIGNIIIVRSCRQNTRSDLVMRLITEKAYI